MIHAYERDQLNDGEKTTDLSETNKKTERCPGVDYLILIKSEVNPENVLRNK